MKAAVYYAYGSPEVIQIVETPIPLPKKEEVRIRITATSVNSGDVRLRKADPFAVRFFMGLFRPKKTILGSVFAGIIESIGEDVTLFKVGDKVFGATDFTFGAYAEYKCLNQNGSICLQPENLSSPEAAVLPFGGTTSLDFLQRVNLDKKKVLIYGASGAVGTAAVQLARYFGAEVTAVCSSSHLSFMKELGAHKVCDYTKESPFSKEEKYDVIYDTVNGLSIKNCINHLAENGSIILGAADLKNMVLGKYFSFTRSVRIEMGMIKHSAESIQFIAERAKQGDLKPVIDRSYTLDEIVQAHAYVDQGHKRGNVVITV